MSKSKKELKAMGLDSPELTQTQKDVYAVAHDKIKRNIPTDTAEPDRFRPNNFRDYEPMKPKDNVFNRIKSK